MITRSWALPERQHRAAAPQCCMTLKVLHRCHIHQLKLCSSHCPCDAAGRVDAGFLARAAVCKADSSTCVVEADS